MRRAERARKHFGETRSVFRRHSTRVVTDGAFMRKLLAEASRLRAEGAQLRATLERRKVEHAAEVGRLRATRAATLLAIGVVRRGPSTIES